MLSLTWAMCGDDRHWCSLGQLDLTTVTAKGVYIIWHDGNPSRVVRVGQGDVSTRLGVHRNNAEILAYESIGELRVTWAVVPATQRDGVERFLADSLDPLVGDVFPDAQPIEVNSPW